MDSWTQGQHTEEEWENGWWMGDGDYEAHLTVADFIAEEVVSEPSLDLSRWGLSR